MRVSFTEDLSIELESKFRIVADCEALFKTFFSTKDYGEDISTILIGLCCLSPRFEMFAKPRKPDYRKEARTYIHQGVEVKTEAKWFAYEVRLNYEKYANADNVRPILAADVLSSLDIISTVKAVKKFDLETFKADVRGLFVQLGWL